MTAGVCRLAKRESGDHFAVYCGAGVYVQSVSFDSGFNFVHSGPFDNALRASRSVAVAALHIARRAGLNAWLVRHPGASIQGAA